MTHRPDRPPQAPSSLVELARRTLNAATEVTLAVSGLDPVLAEGADAVLIDPCGQPVFTSRAGSPVAAAVGRAALVSVTEDQAEPAKVSVHLSGRLDAVRVPSAGTGADHDVRVVLTVDHVVVEYDEPGLASIVQRVVAREAYLGYRTDAFEAAGASIVSHLNAFHDRQLREFAADRAGLGVGEVAAASLQTLDAHGATVAWVDVTGARTADLTFPRTAVRPEAMACLLCQQLIGRCHPECSS